MWVITISRKPEIGEPPRTLAEASGYMWSERNYLWSLSMAKEIVSLLNAKYLVVLYDIDREDDEWEKVEYRSQILDDLVEVMHYNIVITAAELRGGLKKIGGDYYFIDKGDIFLVNSDCVVLAEEHEELYITGVWKIGKKKIIVDYSITDAGSWNQIDIWGLRIEPEGVEIEAESSVKLDLWIDGCFIPGHERLVRGEEYSSNVLKKLEECLRRKYGDNIVIEFKDWTGYGSI